MLEASCSDDEGHVFEHEGPQCRGGDALLRALAGRSASSSSVACSALAASQSRHSAAALMASSVQQRQGTKRHCDLLITKEQIGRQYAVARRLSAGEKGYLSEWAKQNFPERCSTEHNLQCFLRKARTYARKFGHDLAAPMAASQVVRRAGGQGVSGICTAAVPHSKRKRVHGGGGPGIMKGMVIAEELFSWFVDTIDNVKGRLPSGLILRMAHTMANDLKTWHRLEKEDGRIPPHATLELPVLCHQWLARWRKCYSLSWRTCNLRYKCPRATLVRRLRIFWSNVMRVRWLHAKLEPDSLLVFEGFDQKPLWFTAASQEKTLAIRGARKVAVKENLPMTRARFTAMTRCRWPRPPADGKELAILFKAKGGERIRQGLSVPRGVLLQFQERGSYRLEDCLEYLEWILDRSRAVGAASQENRRVVYICDWFAPHLDESLDDLVHAAGHAILRIGGHLTGLVQVEDTHAHAAYTAHYKRREMDESFDQLMLRPDRLPSTSRQTVMERALDAWQDTNHEAASQGFVGNGIANALDGSEDGKLTADVTDFWFEIGMPRIRSQIEAEVVEAIASGTVERFEDYYKLLEPYEDHAPFREGQEAFGVVEGDDDDDGDETPQGEPDEDDDQPPADPPPWPQAASQGEMPPPAEGSISSCQPPPPQTSSSSCRPPPPQTSSSFGQPPLALAASQAGDEGPADPADSARQGDEVAGQSGDEDLFDPAPSPRQGDGQGDPSCTPRGKVAQGDGQGDRYCTPRGKGHKLADSARKSLTDSVRKRHAVTVAALEAVRAAGGDAQLEEQLGNRMRALARSAKSIGDGRVELHAVHLERQKNVERLRAKSKQEDKEKKHMEMVVKARQAEAEIAKARSRESAAEAKKVVQLAQEEAASQASLRNKAAALESHRRLHFAAHLVTQLREYLFDPTAGPGRVDRARRLAAEKAKRKAGCEPIALPNFWTHKTAGFQNLSTVSHLCTRLRAKTEMLWASPDFAWACFGGSIKKQDDPKWALRKLIDLLMPGYFELFGSRYGMPNLIAEAQNSLDLAFLAANWRYTHVVKVKYYRCGLHEWPPTGFEPPDSH